METVNKVIVQFFIFIAIAEIFCQFEEQCLIITMPQAIEDGKYLKDHSFGSVQAMDKNFCLLRCLKQRKCKSVNYNSLSKECQLNSDTRENQQGDFIVSSNNNQYYSLKSVDEVLLGGCAYHNCPDDKLCEELPYGNLYMFQCSTPMFAAVAFTEPPKTETTEQACIEKDGCTNCMLSLYNVGAINYRPIGCILAIGSPNPLATLLSNLRGTIDWANLQPILTDCAKSASASGYKFFGIEFWGECYVSMVFDVSLFSLVSGSNCASQCYGGLAVADRMFVYELV